METPLAVGFYAEKPKELKPIMRERAICLFMVEMLYDKELTGNCHEALVREGNLFSDN